MKKAGDTMRNKMIDFCRYCFKKKEPVILQIFKSDEKIYQRIQVIDIEEEDQYVFFKNDQQEEFLLMLMENKVEMKETQEGIDPTYDAFPREKDWGRTILFEMTELLHGNEVVYAIGTSNESIVLEYLSQSCST